MAGRHYTKFAFLNMSGGFGTILRIQKLTDTINLHMDIIEKHAEPILFPGESIRLLIPF